MKRWRSRLLLTLIGLFALGLRSIGAANVFLAPGEIALWLGDSAYHARLAEYIVAHYPAFMVSDSYLNHPVGAGVPWPPLYDFVVATFSLLAGGTRGALETTLAWMPAVLGAATIVPVHLAARRVGNRETAHLAALIYAGLGVSVGASMVGNADYHAATAFLGACLLASLLAVIARPADRPLTATTGLGLALARAAIGLTWSGSLLYLALGSGVLMLVASIERRRDLLAVEVKTQVLAGLIWLPVVASFDQIAGGPFSALALSWLHVGSAGVAALAASTLWFWEGWRPSSRPILRFGRTTIVSLVVAGAAFSLLLSSGWSSGLAPSLDFVTAQSAFTVAEQTPLFQLARIGSSPMIQFGLFAWLIPLAPLAALRRMHDPTEGLAAVALAAWAMLLGLLTLQQIRFGNEFAAAASICFALGIVALVQQLALRFPRIEARKSIGRALATAIVLLGLLPCATGWYLPQLSALTARRGQPTSDQAVLASSAGSLARFAREVGRVTPASPGYEDPSQRPTYGVLTSPNLGHALRYGARRATSVDGFFEYLDPAVFERATRFFEAETEAEAIGLARRLRSRYVMTWHQPRTRPRSALGRLHSRDALTLDGAPAWSHFRLITEGPAGGTPLVAVAPAARGSRITPYKLFEVVAGARLEFEAEPGDSIAVSVPVETPTGRRFVFRTRARADDKGIGSTVVPYANDADHPVQPTRPYRASVGNRQVEFSVGESAVQEGLTLQISTLGP